VSEQTRAPLHLLPWRGRRSMMGYQTAPLVALMAMFLSPGTATAQDDAVVRKELEAQYQRLAMAHDRRDLKAIVALKTADFHAIFPDGRVGDSKVMEQYSKQFLENNQPPYNRG
jgi:hypothetical protein